MIERTVYVDLDTRSYAIRIAAGALGLKDALAHHIDGPDALVVSNDTVAPLYAGRIQPALGDVRHELVTIADGEQHKNLAAVETIIDALVGMGANRDTTVIALGGGVVGDIAGFAAASYQRGVNFIQVPTTLLAQVDSSVGGKTGVNHQAGKNLIGAFHQPVHVLIDLETLATLPPRELAAGLAEVVKYGVLGDLEFFAWLESNMAALRALDHAALTEAIARSCTAKALVVAADEHERNQRALLNLGHTFGHAIETVAGYGAWLHGEAVAAGMVMAAVASDLAAADVERLQALLAAAGLPTAPPPVGGENLWQAMQLDKKVLSGQVRLVLLRALGDAYVTADYDQGALERALAMADG